MLLVLNACTKEQLTAKEEWEVGAVSGSVTKEISSPSKEIILSMETTSYCVGAFGIKVVVENKGDILYSSEVESFPYSHAVAIPANTPVKITTSVYAVPNSSVVCVWLGNVSCKVIY